MSKEDVFPGMLQVQHCAVQAVWQFGSADLHVILWGILQPCTLCAQHRDCKFSRALMFIPTSVGLVNGVRITMR